MAWKNRGGETPPLREHGNGMTYNPDIHHRRSIRLRGYDYSSAGAYFITVCAHERECLFGEIVGGEMRLSEAGQVVRSVWNGLPSHYPNVELDAFVVMPNHFHGIMVLTDTLVVGAALAPPQKNQDPDINQGAASSAPTLAAVVRAFKSMSAVVVNRLIERSGRPAWQRNYYEHAVRNDDDLAAIRQYIEANPANWQDDKENPENVLPVATGG